MASSSAALEALSSHSSPPPRSRRKRFAPYVVSLWLFLTVSILSSIYALLAYLPLTYFKLIHSPMFPILPFAFKFHAWAYTASAIVLAVSWNRRIAKPRAKVLLFIFLAGICGWLLLRSPYSHLENDGFSASLIVAALLPLLAFLFVAVGKNEFDAFATLAREISLVRVLRLALAASSIHLVTKVLFTWRMTGHLPPWSLWMSGAISMASQSSVAIVIAAAFIGAGHAERRLRWRMPLATMLLAAFMALMFQRCLLDPLPFSIRLAYLDSLLMGTAIAFLLVVRFTMFRESKLPPSRTVNSTTAAVIFIGLFVLFYPMVLSSNDWNMLLQRICALISLGLLAKFLPIRRPSVSAALPSQRRFATILLVASLAGVATMGWLLRTSSSAAEMLTSYMQTDASFHLVKDVLTVSQRVDCDETCRFLYANSNIEKPMTVPTINVTRSATPVAPFNIFVVVVDNLRRDQISPYSQDIDYTPNLQAFAADSTVFRNSLTRYDGTALSEMAIWSGTSQIHKEFPQPFSRVNTLSKLADAYGYKKYVTWDDILMIVLDDEVSSFTKLDANVDSWRQIDICNTWREFANKVDENKSAQPIFFYSQPKNVHNVVLAMQPTPATTRSYAPRETKVSAAIQRVDGCFGDFISALKSRNLYDNSLIVFTADHGYGLEQQWMGHGIYVRPDDLRIPLIIHLPKSLRDRYVADTSQLAFVSDLTPTLLYLLGAHTDAPPEFTGRPLFTRTLAEQSAAARPYYLVESSYFPAFGILTDNGTKLYVDNAHTHRRSFYDLSTDPAANDNILTSEIRKRDEERIRHELNALDHWYNVHLPKESFFEWWFH